MSPFSQFLPQSKTTLSSGKTRGTSPVAVESSSELGGKGKPFPKWASEVVAAELLMLLPLLPLLPFPIVAGLSLCKGSEKESADEEFCWWVADEGE